MFVIIELDFARRSLADTLRSRVAQPPQGLVPEGGSARCSVVTTKYSATTHRIRSRRHIHLVPRAMLSVPESSSVPIITGLRDIMLITLAPVAQRVMATCVRPRAGTHNGGRHDLRNGGTDEGFLQVSRSIAVLLIVTDLAFEHSKFNLTTTSLVYEV